MDRGEHYDGQRHSASSNRNDDYPPQFARNRPSRFPNPRSSNSEFGYGQNRQNLFPRSNRRGGKTHVEPTDWMDFKKHKKNEQPPKFDYKLDPSSDQKPQNCKSTSSYRTEIGPRKCGGHYPEYRINFDNMDEGMKDYWNNCGRQNKEEGASNKGGERQRMTVSLKRERDRTDTKRRREDGLEEIVQMGESISKTNIIKESEKMSRGAQQPSLSFSEGAGRQQESGQNESSSWINQEDVLQDLSKSSLNDCSRKQEVSLIQKHQQDRNPSYLSSIEGHSSSGQYKTLSGLGHDLKLKPVNLNIHKLLEEEGEQQQVSKEEEREDVPELSLIPKEQILSKIQLSSSWEQKDIEIEFTCRKNIVQLRIKEVYLVKLQLTVKLVQDRDSDITMVTNPSIEQDVLQQYIRFHQINQALPRIFQSEPSKVSFSLCNIRVPPRQEQKSERSKELSFIKKSSRPQTDKNSLTLDWQLIRIQKMQLHCMSCNRSNVVPIIHGDLSASLSCKECSESMELQIVKICGG